MILIKILFLSAIFAAESIFPVSGTWKNQKNEAVDFNFFKNKWTLASVAYTSCPATCLMTVEYFKEMELKLASVAPEFLLTSIDPAGDNPEKMRDFFQKKKIQSSHWHFIRGSDDETQNLVRKLGMVYGEKGVGKNSHIMHSTKTAVISPDGKILKIFDTSKADEIVKFLKAQISSKNL